MLRVLLVILAISTVFVTAPRTKVAAVTNSNNENTASFLAWLDQQKHYYTQVKILPTINAKSYLLMDGEQGDVLAGKDYLQSLPVASTTKMLTAITANKLIPDGEEILISPNADKTIGSTMNIIAGETYSKDALLKGLLIQSANDAAVALAEHYTKESGNVRAFVDEMNKLAKSFGLTDTYFIDPAGLDDRGKSSAMSLARIAQLLLDDSYLESIVSTPKATVSSLGGRIIELTNSNRLLQVDSGYYLEGTIGVKTGFTPEAGHCLVTAYKNNDKYFIAVVLHTDEFSVTASAKESRKLLVWASSELEKNYY